MDQSTLQLLKCPKCNSETLNINQNIFVCNNCNNNFNLFDDIIDMRDIQNDNTMNFSIQKDLLIFKVLMKKFKEISYFNGLLYLYEELNKKTMKEIKHFKISTNLENEIKIRDLPLSYDQSIHGFDVLNKIDLYRKDFKIENYKNEICLENGCGHGMFLEGFSKKFNKVLVLDFSLSYLLLAKKICSEKKISNTFFICANAENLPIKKNKIDFIHSNNVIEHVDNQKKMISEIERVLLPNGFLFLLSPNKNSIYFEPHFNLPLYGFIPFKIRSWLVNKMHNRDCREVKLLSFRDLKKIFNSSFKGKHHFTFIPSKLKITAQKSLSRTVIVTLLNLKFIGIFTTVMVNKIFIGIMPYHVIIGEKGILKNNN